MIHYLLVIAVAGVVTLLRLGLPTLDGHEAYVAVTARTMADPSHWIDATSNAIPPNTALNHWLVPVFNGYPRLQKVPLAYWSLAALLKAGAPLNDFTARLPSALAAILLAVVTLALGRRMFSARAALMGALTLATSLGVYSWGRDARADMPMTLWMTVGMACFYVALATEHRRRHAWVLLGCVGIGVAGLAKQFVPLFLVLPIVAYLCWRSSEQCQPGDRQPRRMLAKYLIASAAGLAVSFLILIVPVFHWWRLLGWADTLGGTVTLGLTIVLPLLWYTVRCRPWLDMLRMMPSAVPGVLLALLLFVPWLWYMEHLFAQADSVLAQQTVERAIGAGEYFNASRSLLTGYYLQALVKWTLPWVAFLPGAMAVAFMDRFRPERKNLMFLLLWVVGLLLLFTAAMGKNEQYILPALPAVCLLMGFCMEDVFFNHRWISAKLLRKITVGHLIAGVVAMLGAAVAMAFVPPDWKLPMLHVVVLAGVVSLVLGLGTWALARKRPGLVAASFFLAATVSFAGFNFRADLWDSGRSMAVFAHEAATMIPSGDDVAGYGSLSGEDIYYFGRDIPHSFARREMLIRQHGQEEGQRLFLSWLKSVPGPWLFANTNRERELAEYGFKVVLREQAHNPKRAMVLLHREATKQP